MHVSQENIEELFFDYFEGNLSDAHKTELLQFVHLHPEFEKDFAQWAQAYVPVEESVPDYGIAGSLLKKPPVFFPLKQWALGGTLSVGFAILLSMPFWSSSEKETRLPSSIIIDSPKAILKTTVEKKNEIELKSPIKASKTNRLIEEGRLAENPIHPRTEEIVLSDESSSKPLSSASNPEKILEKEIVLEEASKPVVSKPDSLIPKVAKEEKQSLPFKKKKQKLPLNFKPSPHFMPVNDNF